MSPSPQGTAVWVELSGENLPLAERDLSACSSVLETGVPPPQALPWGDGRFCEVGFSRPGPGALLAQRLAFAHRVLRPVAEGDLDTLVDAMVLEGGGGSSARVRVASGGPPNLSRKLPQVLGHAFLQGGGRIDLESPDRDFLALLPTGSDDLRAENPAGLAEVIGEVPRGEAEARRAKNRPFRKPVTLPPRLARALVNLARVPLGGTVLDPFCGTGAILAEAADLGYDVSGADRDAEMVRGSLRNLSAQGIAPARMVQSDIGRLPSALEGQKFDGVVFDPPYGRASGTGGEGSEKVLSDTLARLPELLSPGGRAAFLVHGPELLPELPSTLRREELLVGERVHRSLTRWVVVLQRGP
ncbi:MAG: methyltransferase domain-containing protein [Euryarchaeota archaeon]|nr:methyltransferase domain-containing protein [Euryarchaeota archaeon]MDE1836215.1 methyltransferase domain-containing protein [Euryarchaeota archaeon]MDE1880868.1 methyltransferase domain-containing protein [Euryarchaeota archaeon]MDE2045024.1 methyltransferase domain-containing protein [Thermoplasmata archaeon]